MDSDERIKPDTWCAIVFWVVVGGVGLFLFLYLQEDHADVHLDVSRKPPCVSGVVTFKGAPVNSGTVHIVVSDAGKKQYRTSTTLSIDEQGKFSSPGESLLGAGDPRRPLQITAEFRGRIVEKAESSDKNKDESMAKSLSGESTVYLNSSPPLRERFLWGSVVALALLLVLFTGDMGRRKARLLFVLMYFFTFFSLAVPIAVSLVVANNAYLVEAMETSPIGLVRAKTKGLAEAQWLVNIGGTVVHEGRASSARTTETPPVPAPIAEPTSDTGREEETITETELGKRSLAAANPEASPGDAIVKGGLAVPFYVVLLAMFGAGINMTLQVPEVQKTYDLDLLETPTPREQLATTAEIRRKLIENYMYLFSAPLLAVGMYYLMLVLAEQVTEPVLVVMAFATGLVAKAVVGGIIQFAEERFLTQKPEEPRTLAEAEAAVKVAAKAVEDANMKMATAKKVKARLAQTEGANAAEKAVAEAEAKRVEAEAVGKEAEDAKAKSS